MAARVLRMPPFLYPIFLKFYWQLLFKAAAASGYFLLLASCNALQASILLPLAI
jgi:hypothetical protein